MAETLEKKLRDRKYRTAFAEAVLVDRVALQIRILREKLGLSQEELGRRAGMKQAAISRIESADYGSWSVGTLKRIAAALDLPLSVKFQSWGDLVRDARHFTPAHLTVPPFERDPAFKVPETKAITQEILLPRLSPISTPYFELSASTAVTRQQELTQ